MWDDYEDTPNYPFYLKLWGKMEAEGWVMESGRGGEVTFFSPTPAAGRRRRRTIALRRYRPLRRR